MIIKNKGRMFDFITKRWNPVAMMKCHGCKYCWATALKKGRLKDFPRYKNLTDESDPILIEHELSKRFDAEDFVFVETMGDLFFDGLPDKFVYAVLKVIEQSPAMFLLLTKNPKRMLKFFPVFPKNVMLGVTIESDLSWSSWSKAPSQPHRIYWCHNLAQLIRHDSLGRDLKLFISIEPIMDFSEVFETALFSLKDVLWGVAIGYDNYDHDLPEPSLKKTNELIQKLDKFIPKIYLKTLRKKR